MSKKQSWNPLEILNDVVEGKIFDGEPSDVERELNGNGIAEETRAPAGEPEQAKAKRKPAESLAASFTKPAAGAATSVTVTPTDTNGTPATPSEESDDNGPA